VIKKKFDIIWITHNSTFAVQATAAETVIRDSSCDVYHIWVGNYCTWMVKIAAEYSELGAI